MEEIDGVRALLSSLPRPTSLAERRERLDTVASAYGTASDIAFEPVRIGTCEAEWSLAPDSDPHRVLLYFHGGGYCSGSIRSHRGMVSEIGRAAKVRTLALGYRLAPEHPFPAALEDAVAAVEYLLAMGIPAERIAIGGDSAGGGLTLATMIRLREAGRRLPACAWLVSPWVDLEMTGASIDTKDADDPLIHRAYLQELASAYRGNGHDLGAAGVTRGFSTTLTMWLSEPVDPRVPPLESDPPFQRGLPGSPASAATAPPTKRGAGVLSNAAHSCNRLRDRQQRHRRHRIPCLSETVGWCARRVGSFPCCPAGLGRGRCLSCRPLGAAARPGVT